MEAETIKLRMMQEKHADEQAIEDQRRARRYQDQMERKERDEVTGKESRRKQGLAELKRDREAQSRIKERAKAEEAFQKCVWGPIVKMVGDVLKHLNIKECPALSRSEEMQLLPKDSVLLVPHVFAAKAKGGKSGKKASTLGPGLLDVQQRKLTKDNIELYLTEKEVNFLALFKNYQKPINKQFILKTAWNYSSESETHTVETHIHRLRKKIFDKFGDNLFIKNNKKGYYI